MVCVFRNDRIVSVETELILFEGELKMKDTTKLNVKKLAVEELTGVAGGYDVAYADEEAEAFSHSPSDDTGTVAPSAAPAAPAAPQRKRVRRYRNIIINGQMRQVAFWTWE